MERKSMVVSTKAMYRLVWWTLKHGAAGCCRDAGVYSQQAPSSLRAVLGFRRPPQAEGRGRCSPGGPAGCAWYEKVHEPTLFNRPQPLVTRVCDTRAPSHLVPTRQHRCLTAQRSIPQVIRKVPYRGVSDRSCRAAFQQVPDQIASLPQPN